MEGGNESKLGLEKLEQVLPELRDELGVVVTDDGLRESKESIDAEDVLFKKLCCLHSINCGLDRNEMCHLGQIEHHH